jgi:hypothetical protein
MAGPRPSLCTQRGVSRVKILLSSPQARGLGREQALPRKGAAREGRGSQQALAGTAVQQHLQHAGRGVLPRPDFLPHLYLRKCVVESRSVDEYNLISQNVLIKWF